ncbi:MAG: hypothetical protein MUP66_04140 [Candidatus Nanohaloarchaeota archaeon QJJ-5]|nr:hypothetical protein [Candidatus Nanohaloarchaeota archaeon QJJ-5]
MAITDQEEAEIITAIMGGLMGLFIRPWNVSPIEGAIAGGILTGVIAVLVGRLSGETFEPDTSAIMGVVIAGTIMLATIL